MVDSRVLSCIVIGICIFLTCVSIGVVIILYNKILAEHDEERDSKNRALELEKSKLDFKLKLYELQLKQGFTKPTTENKTDEPIKASDVDMAAWFDALANPEKFDEMFSVDSEVK